LYPFLVSLPRIPCSGRHPDRSGGISLGQTPTSAGLKKRHQNGQETLSRMCINLREGDAARFRKQRMILRGEHQAD
jgi:hypothetical protein